MGTVVASISIVGIGAEGFAAACSKPQPVHSVDIPRYGKLGRAARKKEGRRKEEGRKKKEERRKEGRRKGEEEIEEEEEGEEEGEDKRRR